KHLSAERVHNFERPYQNHAVQETDRLCRLRRNRYFLYRVVQGRRSFSASLSYRSLRDQAGQRTRPAQHRELRLSRLVWNRTSWRCFLVRVEALLLFVFCTWFFVLSSLYLVLSGL